MFIILGILLVGATIVNAQEYSLGEIIVNFQDNASENEINNLIKSYNLTWKDEYPFFVETDNFKVYVELPEDIMENSSLRSEVSNEIILKDREIYDNDYILTGAWPISFVYLDEYNKSLMVIHFNDRATEQKAVNLINNFEELEIKEIIISEGDSEIIHKWGIIKVPEGEEQIWIDNFESESIVTSAEVNYILKSFSDEGMRGWDFERDVLDPIEGTQNRLIYWIIGLIIIIPIILFLTLKNK